MLQRFRIGAGAVATVALAVGLAACGGGESRPEGSVSELTSPDTGAETGSATGSVTAAETGTLEFTPAEAGATVALTTREWEIISPVTQFSAGRLFVTGTNGGEDVHEVVVTRAGATDEEGAVAEVADIAPGETKGMAVTLPAGRYQFACYIVETEPDGTQEDHFANGMVTEFSVQ